MHLYSAGDLDVSPFEIGQHRGFSDWGGWRNVFLAGTLSRHATDSALHLVAISIGPHVPQAVRGLSSLWVDFGPPFQLGELSRGRISLSAEICGFAELAYCNSEKFGARSTFEKFFGTAPVP
jgi:hypothetical protein